MPLPNGANPSLGALNAPVVLQMWSDFECPFCARAHPVLSELLRVYAGKVRLVWHDYPLPFHSHARLAANAGREAYAEGGAVAFWKFTTPFTNHPTASSTAQTSSTLRPKRDSMRRVFTKGSARCAMTPRSSKTWLSGDAVGVEGTPAFLVNDYFFVGAVPIEIMRVVVDRALSDAR